MKSLAFLLGVTLAACAAEVAETPAQSPVTAPANDRVQAAEETATVIIRGTLVEVAGGLAVRTGELIKAPANVRLARDLPVPATTGAVGDSITVYFDADMKVMATQLN